jgi:serine/threonine protein kinase
VIDLAKKYNRPIAPEIAASIIESAADGLHFAHELTDSTGVPVKLVHRDISPSNIMLTYYGNVKVLDFGIAKATTNLGTTRAGAFKGKLAYVAPEQLPGTRGWEIDRRCDVYCLGIVLWELLTGERLFARDSDIATMMAIHKGEIPSVRSLRPEIDVDLEEIAQKALARNPDDRYQTAGEFHDKLDRYLTGRAMRPSTKQLALWLEGLFGEKRASAKKSIAQGVNLRASVSEVMRTISKMDIGVEVLGKVSAPQPSTKHEEDSNLYAETLRKPAKPRSSEQANLSSIGAPEQSIDEQAGPIEKDFSRKRLALFVTFVGFAILALLLSFWLTSCTHVASGPGLASQALPR